MLWKSALFRPVAVCIVAAAAGGLGGGCAQHHHHRQTDDATLTQADLPPNVEKSFVRDHKTATIKQIDKQTADSVVRYRITYFDEDGSRHQVMYDREGDELPMPGGDAPGEKTN